MGWQNAVSVRALQVIVSSGGTGQGVFLYSGTPAAGNGPVFAATAPGVTKDPFGNTIANVIQVGQNSGGHLQIDQFGELIAYDSAGHQTVFLNPQNQYVALYTPTLATGNLTASVAAQATTDTASNTVRQGVAAYASGGFPYTQLTAGIINFQGTSGQNTPGTIQTTGIAGEMAISSGLATGGDSAANVIVDSAAASGVSTASILLQAAATTLNTNASSSTPSLNTNPGHNSAAPATYNQAYEQANTNRINQILDVLVQTGIWHA